MPEIIVDPENKEFVNILDLMENTNSNLFITGEAGTGKSTLLRYFVSTTIKNVAVLAPTGLAAINAGGQTIHKFCLFPPRFITPEDIKITKNPIHKKLLQQLDTILLDEISMVRADQFDGIDRFLRINRKKNLPFGGVQMILVGDLFQLPPVVNSQEMSLFSQIYQSPYFFSSQVFTEIYLPQFSLLKNYRQQSDLQFISILRDIKKGSINSDLIDTINQQFKPEFNNPNFSKEDIFINLTTTNQIALQINTIKLNELEGNNVEYWADLEGEFNERDCPAENILILKKNAQIMFIKNDTQGRWVNGTMGTIEEAGKDKIVVKLENGNLYTLSKEKWNNIKFEFDENEDKIISKIIGSMTQYPIKLAWAVTIHKSQGQTFDKLLIDLGRGAFSHGQTYVALSRARNLSGIRLKRKVLPSDFILDKRIVQFMQSVEKHDMDVARVI